MNSNLLSISLPTITLHRPLALWVRLGWKTVETRLHARFQSLVGKRIAIHAGLHWDLEAVAVAQNWLTARRIAETAAMRENDAFRGQIVAIANVDWCGWIEFGSLFAPTALIDCTATKRYGLGLTNIVPTTSEHVKGGQGIFRCPVAVCRSRFR